MSEVLNMQGVLYIVATPIGNLEDITMRALRILKEVDLILAEDTRVTNKLLGYYDIDKPTLSYHQHSSEQKKKTILTHLSSGRILALVTDAGTPGISDPGNELVYYLSEKLPNIKIVPIPGASALTSALSVSGFKTNKFIFLGFLPKRKRQKLFKWLKEGPSAISGRTITFAFYESPNRIMKTLEFLEETLGGDKRIFIARELTKLHESLYRGTVKKVRERLKKEKIRGEIVVVVEI